MKEMKMFFWSKPLYSACHCKCLVLRFFCTSLVKIVGAFFPDKLKGEVMLAFRKEGKQSLSCQVLSFFHEKSQSRGVFTVKKTNRKPCAELFPNKCFLFQ